MLPIPAPRYKRNRLCSTSSQGCHPRPEGSPTISLRVQRVPNGALFLLSSAERRKTTVKIYTAQKPCRFGGKEYRIGDEVPEKLIDPTRVKSLIKFGLLSVSERAEETADTPAQTGNEGDLTNDQSTDEAKQSDEGDKEPENTQETDQQQIQSTDEEKQAEETTEKPKATGKKGAKK
jgi:hypothetical protein